MRERESVLHGTCSRHFIILHLKISKLRVEREKKREKEKERERERERRERKMRKKGQESK